MKSTSLLRYVLNLTILAAFVSSIASCSVMSTGARADCSYRKSSLVGDWNLVGTSTETYVDGLLVSKEEGAPVAPDSSFSLGKDGWALFQDWIGAWDLADNRLKIRNGRRDVKDFELLSLSRSKVVIRWEYSDSPEDSGRQTFIVGEYSR